MEWPVITKDTPISEIQRIHRMIWDYVIENGEKPKTPYFCDCACCEYDTLRADDCSTCPLYDRHACFYLYIKWNLDEEARDMIAKQIRDAPFKEES